MEMCSTTPYQMGPKLKTKKLGEHYTITGPNRSLPISLIILLFCSLVYRFMHDSSIINL